MKQLLTSPDICTSAYDWVWALDEDVDFTQTNVSQLFEDADATGSSLVLPSFQQLESGPDIALSGMNYPMQAPHSQCRFRYTPMVEVIFPLIRPAALWKILTECEHCIHKSSVWGLDRMWCSWTARKLNKAKEKNCAILDQTSVLHRNFRSLPGKYRTGGHT